MIFRRAQPAEAERLSRIAQAAKAHWPYPPDQLAAWRNELTLSARGIADRPTHVVEVAGEVVGFYQLLPAPNDWLLEHFWLLPRAMGRGLGRALLRQALEVARAGGAVGLAIDSDPYAEGFYRDCGAEPAGSLPAPIPGEPDRVRPQLRLAASNPSPASS